MESKVFQANSPEEIAGQVKDPEQNSKSRFREFYNNISALPKILMVLTICSSVAAGIRHVIIHERQRVRLSQLIEKAERANMHGVAEDLRYWGQELGLFPNKK